MLHNTLYVEGDEAAGSLGAPGCVSAGTTVCGVSTIDAGTGAVIETVPLTDPQQLVLDESASRLYVAAPSGVTMLDAATGALLATVPITSSAFAGAHIALDEPADLLLVSSLQPAAHTVQKTLTEVRASTGQILRRLPVETGEMDDAVPIVDLHTQRVLIYTDAGAGAGAPSFVKALDLESGAVRSRLEIPGCPYAAGGPLGRVYAACQSNWLGNDYPVPAGPGELRAYDENTGTLLGRVPLGTLGQNLLVDTRTEQIFVFMQAGIAVIDGHGLGLVPRLLSPETAPATAACCGARYFPRTRHNLSGPFLAFWQHNGGLDLFGYPLTEPFVQDAHWSQATERFLLQEDAGQVRVAPLGRLLTASTAFPPVPPFVPTPDRRYFPSTRHSLTGRFLAYWQSHHGVVLLGAPISEIVLEANGDGSGRRYQTQWFENGRLEYHPELAGTAYEVEVGQVGREYLKTVGWL